MQPIDIHRIREDEGLGMFRGMANVFAFYACCALIVGGVVIFVKAIR